MQKTTWVIRIAYTILILASIFVVSLAVLLLESKIYIFNKQSFFTETKDAFPISVDPKNKLIYENNEVWNFYSESLAYNPNSKNNWQNQVAAVFTSQDWYQNLASPVSRIIVIWPGERKEEAVKSIGEVLRWDKAQREEFKSLIDTANPIMSEGKYLPGQYVIHRHATPEDVFKLINDSFKSEVLSRYTPELEEQVPLKNALVIASLLEREASDFENMREVSGVIWNRLFTDMPLQLDATLQYIRGSNAYEPLWWPKVNPRDKFLDSPFNTYTTAGLPPHPIANPSPEAILAALNPVKTDCLFYFHTSNGDYYCSENYNQHVKKLQSIYGRGS